MIAVLGWAGSALVVASLLQRDLRRLRQVNLLASATLGVFNVALGIASMIVLNLVLAAVNGYHLLGERRTRRDVAAGPVGPTTLGDPVLEAVGSHRAMVR